MPITDRLFGQVRQVEAAMVDTVMTPEAFGQLLSQTRPRLHRYCARMLGSAFDGEDVVQDAMAKAIEALPEAGHLDNPERWLFRIAHNTALDALRRRKRQAERHTAAELAWIEDPSADAAARVDSAGSFAVFLALPPTQRACVVLTDVLGYANAETADILDTTIAAVKADLHRGREKLKAQKDEPAFLAIVSDAEKARLRNYADLFNARDFDALRDLLAEDVRLDLVNRTRLNGRRDVSVYFTRYAAAPPWRFALGSAEGRPALLVSAPDDDALRFVVLLGWAGDKVVSIRDFHYAPYIVNGLATQSL